MPIDGSWPILAAGVAVVSTVALTLAINRRLASWRGRRRARRGYRAEHRACRLVQSAGYQVTNMPRQASYPLLVDGVRHEAIVRADMFARRGRRRYLVEVKTGQGSDPLRVSTRRQLLEYRHAFGIDGLLLADMDRATLRLVQFVEPGAGRRFAPLIIALLVGVTLGAALAAVVLTVSSVCAAG